MLIGGVSPNRVGRRPHRRQPRMMQPERAVAAKARTTILSARDFMSGTLFWLCALIFGGFSGCRLFDFFSGLLIVMLMIIV